MVKVCDTVKEFEALEGIDEAEHHIELEPEPEPEEELDATETIAEGEEVGVSSVYCFRTETMHIALFAFRLRIHYNVTEGGAGGGVDRGIGNKRRWRRRISGRRWPPPLRTFQARAGALAPVVRVRFHICSVAYSKHA